MAFLIAVLVASTHLVRPGVADGASRTQSCDACKAEQGHDRVQRLSHHASLLVGVDAKHRRVRGQLARANAEHDPAASQVVEQDHALDERLGVVVGEGADACAQTNVLRPLGRNGNEDFWGRDDLVAT